MKRIFFLSLYSLFFSSFLLISSLKAQDFSYTGFKGGLSVSRAAISFDQLVADSLGILSVESETNNGRFRLGGQVGVFAGKEFTKSIGIRLELNYTQMGRIDTINFNQRQNYAFHYFTFDPMLQIRLAKNSPNHFYILMGASGRLLAGNTARQGGEEIPPLRLRQFDAGANLGFSYLIGLTPYLYLTLEARAYYGLLNVAEKPNENAVGLNEYANAFNTVLTSADPTTISEQTRQTVQDAATNGFENNLRITNQGAIFSIGFCVPLRPPMEKFIKIKR